MGLDIFFYKTKHAYNGDRHELRDLTEKDAQDEMRKKYDAAIKKIKACKSGMEMEEQSVKCAKSLSKLINYPQFTLDKIGVQMDYSRGELTFTPTTLSVWEKEKESIIKDTDAKFDAYFRKVNFIFDYFAEKGKMEEEYFAWIDKDDVEDIIDRCDKVLADHSLADKLLPTQSGPFFGSTEYDEWYFLKVKNARKQMKGLLKFFDKGYNMYVIFSW